MSHTPELLLAAREALRMVRNCPGNWENGVRERLEHAIAEAEGQPQSANEQLPQPVETAEESANNIELLAKAVKLIRQFHAIPIADRDEKQAWKLYYANAPEMKPLREALEKVGITEVKL